MSYVATPTTPGSGATAAFKFQWKDTTGWVDYDAAAQKEIEAGIAKGLSEIPLTQGWFAGKGYKVFLFMEIFLCHTIG